MAIEYYKEDIIENGLICNIVNAHPNDPLGGYLTIGFHDNPTSEHYPILTRIDKYGNKIWQKIDSDIPHGPKSGYYTDDFGFMLGGNSFVTRIDKDGERVVNNIVGDISAVHFEKISNDEYVIIGSDWEAKYKVDKDGNKTELPYVIKNVYSIKKVSDGYVLCGWNKIVKLKPDFTYDNSFDYDGVLNFSDFVWFYNIEETKDGNYVTVGYDMKIVIRKIDKNGDLSANTNWTLNTGLTAGTLPVMHKTLGLKVLSSGDIQVGGTYKPEPLINNNSDYFLMRLDNNGNEKWFKSHYSPTKDDGFYWKVGFAATVSGDCIVGAGYDLGLDGGKSDYSNFYIHVEGNSLSEVMLLLLDWFIR